MQINSIDFNMGLPLEVGIVAVRDGELQERPRLGQREVADLIVY